VSLDDFDAELPKHDVVVLAAPLTSQTASLLTAERLDLLPSNAIVVNVARGAMVDERALAERLLDGRLRAAALDVFREEPLPATSPLWPVRQILLTPHVSPVSPGRFWPRQLDLFLDNWRHTQGRAIAECRRQIRRVLMERSSRQPLTAVHQISTSRRATCFARGSTAIWSR
jgi:phosphoglycerate dehydrogenase-like enzyme